MTSVSDYELGWLVGLLEGEANFVINCSPHGGRSQRVVVEMTDQDVIFTVANLFERITGNTIHVKEKFGREGRQSTFIVSATGENARTIMSFVVRRMHFRRRKRIHQSLNNHIPRRRTAQIVDLSEIITLKETTK